MIISMALICGALGIVFSEIDSGIANMSYLSTQIKNTKQEIEIILLAISSPVDSLEALSTKPVTYGLSVIFQFLFYIIGFIAIGHFIGRFVFGISYGIIKQNKDNSSCCERCNICGKTLKKEDIVGDK